jgi:hypothetical protein
MIESLRTRRINTLVELRRVEKAFATLGSSDLNEPMTSACELALTDIVSRIWFDRW